MEFKVLAMQVNCIITIHSFSILVNFIDFFLCKFPPIFSYKKQKDGNYTFAGLGYELMEDVKNDLELKYVPYRLA